MHRLPRALSIFLVGLICFSFVPVTASATQMLSPTTTVDPTQPGRKFKGDWTRFYSDDFDGDLDMITINTGCTGQAQLWGQENGYGTRNVNWSVKFGSVECWTHRPRAVPGPGSWPDEPWKMTMQLQGLDPAGKPCTTSANPITITSLDGSIRWSKWGFQGMIGPAIGAYVKCQYARWNVVATQDAFGLDRKLTISGDLNFSSFPPVSEVPTTEPPPETGVCTKGKPANVSVVWSWSGTPGPSGARKVQVTVNAQTGFTGDWNVAAVVKHKSTGEITSVQVQYNARTGQLQLAPPGTSGTIGAGDNWDLVGVQVSSPVGPDMAKAPGTNSATVNYGYGVTNGGMCRFWFGPKVWDDGAPGGFDVPWGGAGAEPPVDPYVPPTEDEPIPTEPVVPPECTFKISDPTTWLEAGMCAVVGLLSMLLEAIIDLPVAMLEAIGAVFVPDPAVLTATAGDLQTAWADSSPGAYFTGAASVYNSFSPTTGPCAGPSIGIHHAGVNLDMKPMNACGGTGATVATVSRAVITLSVIIGTFFALLRIIAGSLGYNLNGIGGRGDD